MFEIVIKRFILSLTALALFASIAPARAWTDIHGRKIEGEFIRQDAESVVLQLPGRGKPVAMPLANLSEADREFLRAQASSPPAAATGKYAAQWTGDFAQGNFEEKLPFLLRVPMDHKKGELYEWLLARKKSD